MHRKITNSVLGSRSGAIHLNIVRPTTSCPGEGDYLSVVDRLWKRSGESEKNVALWSSGQRGTGDGCRERDESDKEICTEHDSRGIVENDGPAEGERGV